RDVKPPPSLAVPIFPGQFRVARRVARIPPPLAEGGIDNELEGIRQGPLKLLAEDNNLWFIANHNKCLAALHAWRLAGEDQWYPSKQARIPVAATIGRSVEPHERRHASSRFDRSRVLAIRRNRIGCVQRCNPIIVDRGD